jgi:hypothetical protein
MRKIENDMIGAINARIRNPLESGIFWKGNTTVHRDMDTNAIEVKLHRNLIAKIEHDGKRATYVTLNDGGWQTMTTKSRLNAIAQAFNVSGVYQKKFSWYLDDGTPFEGEHRLKVNSRRKHAA